MSAAQQPPQPPIPNPASGHDTPAHDEPQSLQDLRVAIASELGFPNIDVAGPFLALCENVNLRDDPADYLDLFLRTLRYFSQPDVFPAIAPAKEPPQAEPQGHNQDNLLQGQTPNLTPDPVTGPAQDLTPAPAQDAATNLAQDAATNLAQDQPPAPDPAPAPAPDQGQDPVPGQHVVPAPGTGQGQDPAPGTSTGPGPGPDPALAPGQDLDLNQDPVPGQHAVPVPGEGQGQGQGQAPVPGQHALTAPALGQSQDHVPGTGQGQGQDPAPGTGTGPAPAPPPTQQRARTIMSWVAKLVSQDEPLFRNHSEEDRKRIIIDQVLIIIGSWTAMMTYFMRLSSGYRPIIYAYTVAQGINNLDTWESRTETALAASCHDLIDKSKLFSNSIVPGPATRRQVRHVPSYGSIESSQSQSPLLLHTSLDLLEAAVIRSNILNAHTLAILAGVRIKWTVNVSRHMLLSQFGGSHVLEVFAIPSMLEYGKESMAKAGVPDAFLQEVLDSYAILFNPKSNFDPHGTWGGWLRRPWCWCISCSSRRLRKAEFERLADYATTLTELLVARRYDKSEYDPFLKVAMSRPARDWSPRIFPTLWPRIAAAESYLREAKPWNFWVLFRDRRDSLPFWTFFFAIFVVILTVVQVVLGVAQVVGSFK